LLQPAAQKSAEQELEWSGLASQAIDGKEDLMFK